MGRPRWKGGVAWSHPLGTQGYFHEVHDWFCFIIKQIDDKMGYVMRAIAFIKKKKKKKTLLMSYGLQMDIFSGKQSFLSINIAQTPQTW